jgi:cell division protein FtsX
MLQITFVAIVLVLLSTIYLFRRAFKSEEADYIPKSKIKINLIKKGNSEEE